LLPLLQCLHGLSFGATHLGALGFVVRVAPEGSGVTAQGYLSVALGLAMAGATGLAGLVYERFGSAAYAVMALAASVGMASALVAHRLRR
jgi:PPP family 3-phenylpropionic acid transporter